MTTTTPTRSTPRGRNDKEAASKSREEFDVRLDSLDPHPLQMRLEIHQEDLAALAASIADSGVGLLHRITVRTRRGAPGRYEVLAGSRRVAAAKAAGWSTIPATLRDVDDATAANIAAAENFQRRKVSAMETAQFLDNCRRPVLEGGLGMTTAQLARHVGFDDRTVLMYVSLLKLPEVWRERVAVGAVSPSAAQCLVAHVDDERVMEAIDADYRANPRDWKGRVAFRRLVAFIAKSVAQRAVAESAADNGHDEPATLASKMAPRESGLASQAAAPGRDEPASAPPAGRAALNEATARRLLSSFAGCRTSLETLRAVIDEMLAEASDPEEAGAAVA